MDFRALFSGGWEKNTAVASAVISAGALIVSLVALSHSSQQTDIAKEALRASEKNAAFLSLVKDLSAFCQSLDLSRGANRFSWLGPFKTSERLQILAFYQPNYQVPKSDNRKLIDEAQAKFDTVGAVQTALQVWLNESEYKFVNQSLFDLRNIYIREIEEKLYASLQAESYLRVAALCFGTRDGFIEWYKNPVGATTDQMPKLKDVRLTSRSPGP